MSVDFKTLLEQSKKLTPAKSELPKLERGLSQIDELSRKLAAKSASVPAADFQKAPLLLAGKGFDSDVLTRSLEQIDLTSSFEPLEPVAETDLRGFLAHQHQSLVMTIIEEAKKATVDDFENKVSKTLYTEWEAAKREILDAFESPTSGEQSKRKIDIFERVQTTGMPGRSHLTAKMSSYARALWKILSTRTIENRGMRMAREFMITAAGGDERWLHRAEIVDAWNLLVTMLSEKSVGNGSAGLEQTFVLGAIHFLEEQYRNHMTQEVRANRSVVRVSGKPSVENLIRGWLSVKGKGGIWAQVYYALRCGEVDTAISFSRAGDSSERLELFLEHFARRPEPLPPSIAKEIHSDYRVALRESNDPFKVATLNILGHCDPDFSDPRIFQLLPTAQDFLWMKLVFVAFVAAEEPYPLNAFQSLLTSYGPSHFTPNGRAPLLYFLMLCASQQFVAAIEYLQTVDVLSVETVHFALVLNSIVKPSLDETLGKIIVAYVRRFASAHPTEAFSYLWLIPDETNRVSRTVSLLLETNEFATMLGFVDANGARHSGAASAIMSVDDQYNLTEHVASECVANGRYIDAIRLYDLAELFDEAVSILNDQMGFFLGADSPQRNELLDAASTLQCNFEPHRVTAHIREAFEILRELARFFEHAAASQYEQALETIHKIELVPFVEEEIDSRFESFKSLEKPILRNFPAVLVGVMTCLYRLAEQYRSVAGEGTRNTIAELQERARVLVGFASLVQYRLPADVKAKLMRMELWMA